MSLSTIENIKTMTKNENNDDYLNLDVEFLLTDKNFDGNFIKDIMKKEGLAEEYQIAIDDGKLTYYDLVEFQSLITRKYPLEKFN